MNSTKDTDMVKNLNILKLIRDDVSHNLESCMQYSKETGKTIPIAYDERNTQLKEGDSGKFHATNIEDGKIKRTDKSMDGSKLERTGECIPCWTDEELLNKMSKKDVLNVINDLLKRYELRTPSFGQAIRKFKDDKETSSIAVYIIEYQQQAQRHYEGLRNISAGGTEFYWINNELDKPGEALKNRLEQYTSETIATKNWNQSSKGTYRLDLLDEVIILLKRDNEKIKYVMIKCRGNKTTIILNAIAQIGNAERVLWTGRYPSAHSGPIDDCVKWQELRDYYETIEVESVNTDIDKEIEKAKNRRHNNPPKAYMVIVNLQKLEERNENPNELYKQLENINWDHKIYDESGLGGNTERTMEKISRLSGDIIQLDGCDHLTIIDKCTKDNSVIWLELEEFEEIVKGRCPNRPQKITICDELSNFGDSEYEDESNHLSVLLQTHGEKEDARFVNEIDVESDIWAWYGEPGMPSKNYTWLSLGLENSKAQLHISISGVNQCYAMKELVDRVINSKLPDGKKLFTINLCTVSGSPREREEKIKTIIKEVTNEDNKSYLDYGTVLLIGDSKLIRGAGIPVIPVNYSNKTKSSWLGQFETRSQNTAGIIHQTLSAKDNAGNYIPVAVVFERDPYRQYAITIARSTVRKKVNNNKGLVPTVSAIQDELDASPVWLNSTIGGKPNQLKEVDVIERCKKISNASDFVKGNLNTNIVSDEELLGVSGAPTIDSDKPNDKRPRVKIPRKKPTKKKTTKEKNKEQAIRTILGQLPKMIYTDPTIDCVDKLCSPDIIENIYDKVKPVKTTKKNQDSKFSKDVVETIIRKANTEIEDIITVFREKVITKQVDFDGIAKVSAVKSNGDIPLPLEVAEEMVNHVT